MELYLLEYRSNYEVDVLPDEPDSGATYQFFQERRSETEAGELTLEVTQGRSDWLVLEVKDCGGNSWTGIFEPGVEGISALYATPSDSVLCVVVKGQGYWVPVFTPEEYEVIPSVPIKKVLAVPKAKLMLFVDFVRLTAYGEDGFLWQTERLSWDGLTITEVLEREVNGVAWDAPSNREVPFSVDTRSGHHTGGSSPD